MSFKKKKYLKRRKRLKFLEEKEPKNLGKELNNTVKIVKQNELKEMKKNNDKKSQK